MTMIFAHRGFSGYYPENTMLAFQKVAEESKADGIELDIQLTKDGEIVIMHDEKLDRTTNGSGWLKDYTLAELKTLSVPTFHNWLHQELLDELYPTLATTVTPSPYKVTQADIDDALRDWRDNLSTKQEIAAYMQAHGRERETAAWLAKKYGWSDVTKPMQVSVGSSEPVTLSWAKVQRRIAQLIREDKFFTEQEKALLAVQVETLAQEAIADHSQEYRLLDRLRADCEYFLGAGARAEKHLWAGNVRAQIAKLRELYDALPEKPEWLTKEAIDDYAERMAPPYQVIVYHHMENGFDEKLDYQTLQEAEAAAQGYVDGTMESDGFAYDGAAIYDQQAQRYLRIYTMISETGLSSSVIQ